MAADTYQNRYIRDQVLELYRWSRQEHWQRFCESALIWYKHYRNIVDPRIDEDDYHSNMGIGLAFPIIEIMHARLMEPWVQGADIIKATADEEAGRLRAPRTAAYINHSLRRVITRPMSKLGLVKKSALIFGRGGGKWRVKRDRARNVLTRVPIVIGEDIVPGGFRVGSTMKWVKTAPEGTFEFDYVDPFNCWRAAGRFMEDSEWVFEDAYLSDSEIWAQVESGNWSVNPEELSPSGYDSWVIRRMSLESGWQDTGPNGGNRKPHKRTEFQGRIEVKRTRGSRPVFKDMFIEILNEDELAADPRELETYNGRPSYLWWEPVQDSLSERAIGVIEPMEDALIELNSLANIALDNARKIIESPLAIDPSMTKQETIYLGPAELNWIRNPSMAIKAIEMKDLPRSFYQFLGWLNDLVQRISGVSDYFGGLNTSDTSRVTKTATGMSLMANLSASRFGPVLGSLDVDVYQKLAEAIHLTARQRMTQSTKIRLPGNPESPYQTIGPEDLDVVLGYSFNTRALDPSASIKRAEFIEMIDRLTGLQPLLETQGVMVDLYELVQVLMDQFNHGADVEKVLKRMVQDGTIPLTPTGGPGEGMGQPALPGRPQLAAGSPQPDPMSGPVPPSQMMRSGVGA